MIRNLRQRKKKHIEINLARSQTETVPDFFWGDGGKERKTFMVGRARHYFDIFMTCERGITFKVFGGSASDIFFRILQ